MEQFLRVALWTAAIFCFLQASKSLSDKDAKIEFMRDDVKCKSNSTFYGPKNVKKICIAEALECVKAELGVVQFECEGEIAYVDNAVEFMDRKINSLGNRPTPTTKSECDCHKWPQVPFPEFLDNMESLLQLVKSTTESQLKS